MSKYSDIPVMICRPEVTADFLNSIRQKQEELLKMYLYKREEFSIRVGKRNGQFIGEFISTDVDTLLKKPIEFFLDVSSEYALYFGAVQNRTFESLHTDVVHIDQLFDTLRGRFGMHFDLQVRCFKLYKERVDAWNNYWVKEFGK